MSGLAYARGMRFVVVVGVLVGCGSVKSSSPNDGPATGDGPACAGDTVEACGADCAVCDSDDDRAMPTCNGASCGTACIDSTCTDQSCSKLTWAFSSGKTDGATPRLPQGLALAVRNHLGSPALAIDVTSLTEVSFRIPICLSGTLDLRNTTFGMDVFFEGGDPNGMQYFTQVSVPGPANGNFVGNQAAVQAGTTFHFTGTVPNNTEQGMATELTVQAGTFGAAFAGTIWFDNLVLE